MQFPIVLIFLDRLGILNVDQLRAMRRYVLLGVVIFAVVATPGGLRVPVVGTFPETNVRTYVRDRSGRPGVWFSSLEAGGLAATVTARFTYGLPYFWADMRPPSSAVRKLR